ncbi:DMT family transporter [Geminicoccus harenae]|uniref:DMT family transporter n=1 Tax=Geminicoccus harenae TaxID=2498453 RepID=UPI00168BD253|nr:DMT family transporter [Geminicoccus harenae]
MESAGQHFTCDSPAKAQLGSITASTRMSWINRGRMLKSAYVSGLILSASGMLLMGPDSMLLRLVSTTNTAEIILFRTLFIGISLALAARLLFGRSLLHSIKRLDRLGWLAVIGLTGNQLGFVIAIGLTSVANTLVLLATILIFAAIFGRIFLGERVPPRMVVAISLALGGIVIIFAGSIGLGTITGDLAAIATAALYALYIVFLRQTDTEIMLVTLCLSALFAALITLPLAIPFEVTGQDFTILLFLGGLLLPLAFVLFFSGARYLPAAEVGLLALLETVLGPLWVWVGIGETPQPAALAGGALVVSAIVINALCLLWPGNGQPAAQAGQRSSPAG